MACSVATAGMLVLVDGKKGGHIGRWAPMGLNFVQMTVEALQWLEFIGLHTNSFLQHHCNVKQWFNNCMLSEAYLYYMCKL